MMAHTDSHSRLIKTAIGQKKQASAKCTVHCTAARWALYNGCKGHPVCHAVTVARLNTKRDC